MTATAQPATGEHRPYGKTSLGRTVWTVPNQPGRYLVWDGPGAQVEITKRTSRDNQLGSVAGSVDPAHCQSIAEAQAIVDGWLATGGTC